MTKVNEAFQTPLSGVSWGRAVEDSAKPCARSASLETLPMVRLTMPNAFYSAPFMHHLDASCGIPFTLLCDRRVKVCVCVCVCYRVFLEVPVHQGEVCLVLLYLPSLLSFLGMARGVKTAHKCNQTLLNGDGFLADQSDAHGDTNCRVVPRFQMS